MKTICGADCDVCNFKSECKGCEATCGKPFGGTCVAAEYIKVGGKDLYAAFKKSLLAEINTLLLENGLPPAGALYELPGAYVNLPYPLPSGKAAAFLDDQKIYLGAQIKLADTALCCGVVADTNFILLCTYGLNGSEPELIAYKKR